MRLPKSSQGLYRSRDGVLFGVCRGLAEYFDLSVFWVRIIALAAFIFTGLWPAGVVYLILALVMKPSPVVRLDNEAQTEFYHSYADSRPMALGRLKRSFDQLERRLRRLEDVVTSRDFQWGRRAGRG